MLPPADRCVLLLRDKIIRRKFLDLLRFFYIILLLSYWTIYFVDIFIDGRQMHVTVNCDPPMKQGQTRYHYLVLIFKVRIFVILYTKYRCESYILLSEKSNLMLHI